MIPNFRDMILRALPKRIRDTAKLHGENAIQWDDDPTRKDYRGVVPYYIAFAYGGGEVHSIEYNGPTIAFSYPDGTTFEEAAKIAARRIQGGAEQVLSHATVLLRSARIS
jgi:hypothetical protein